MIPHFILSVDSKDKALAVALEPDIWRKVLDFFKSILSLDIESVEAQIGQDGLINLKRITTYFYLADTEEKTTIDVLNRIFGGELDEAVF